MTRQSKRLFVSTCLCLLATGVLAGDGLAKWSRQLEETGPGEADSFDWIPLAQPAGDGGKDRSANGRVLTYSQSFPPNARFGDPSKPHNAPVSQQPQSFDFPYQFQRYLNSPHAQPLRQHSSPFKSSGLQSQEPTSQSFFKFEMPYHGEGGRPAGAPPTLQTGYQIQHTFGGGAQASVFSSPLFNQHPVFPPEFHPPPPPPPQKPQQQYLQQKPLHQQNYIEDSLPAKHHFRESKPVPTQSPSLQSVTPQVFSNAAESDPIFELSKPTSFQSPFQHGNAGPSAAPSAPNQQQQGQEEVQLLYVPYDTLYNQQQPQRGAPTRTPSFEVNKFNVNPGLPAVNPYQINQFYTQDPLAPQDNGFYTTSTTNRPLTTSSKPSNLFQSYAKPQFSTAKPKPKAHQPPLAMFLLRSSSRPTQSDVVAALRNANTIAVIDAPTKATPPIFVGPGGMPIPDGYVKFDLPYLSQLSQSRDLHDVPFFVAPLSYRTPNGFNKILLPEPHVGSIVVNRAKDYAAPTQQTVGAYNAPTTTTNDSPQYTTSTQRPRPHRVKQPAPPKEYYPEVVREPHQPHNRHPFEVTTQRGTLQPSRGTAQPSRGNKFSYFYDQDGIQEVTSPKATKPDRPKKKRPQNVQVDRPAFTQTITNPYAQFQPMPNQILNDDYYKVQTSNKPTTTTTSTTTSTTSTTSTTPVPPTLFTYSTSPQVEFHSTSGQLYPDYNATPAKETVEDYVPRFTTRPPPSTAADEEYRMKQYFRQQDAFRSRNKLERPTNPPYEQVQYTPVSLDYEREVTIPSTTQRTTTSKQRVTFYTPTATPATTTAQESFNTLPPRIENISEYHQSVQTDSDVPLNHRPSYNQNEIPDGKVEYDPNPYQLPSELPPLTPNLPGLVNDLQEKERQNAIEQTAATTPLQELEQPTRPTRRPINRVRKPVVSKVTSSVSYSESEAPSKRPSHRIRRPYGSRGSANSASTASDDESISKSTSTTRRPTSARNSAVRNPNRVRYQPTPEERQSLRLKPRKQYNGSKKVSQSEDIDYQRDVLNQNYPVFKGATTGSRKPSSSPTAIPNAYGAVSTTSEGPTSETQQVYTVTPSNTIDNEHAFPAGLLEPMQIAQQYEYSNNYGPGYFPNQEDLSPTEAVLRNEISPVYSTVPSTTTTTTSKATTTEEPQTTTRRSPFIRRNYPRLRTTTEVPTTTTPATEERTTTRSRTPPRKVIKVRTRNRRPYHPASSTTAPEDDVQPEQKNNYRKSNRYNQNTANTNENEAPIRRRYKPQFQLDGQESQWSPAVKTSSTNNNSFKPLNPKDARDEDTHKFENEPDIVTVGPDQGDETKKSDTYEINVSANFGSTGSGTKTTLKAPNLKPEKSFAELLEEVMGKAPDVKPTDSEVDTRTTDGTYFESQKTTTINHRLNRRGKWKKLRNSANNNESFETAESQNLGPQLLNSLYSTGQNKKTVDESVTELGATTAMSPQSTTETALLTTTNVPYFSTTPTPATTMDEYDMTTSQLFDITTTPTTLPMDEAQTTARAAAEDSATRRLDTEDLAPRSDSEDLETQPSLFSEVKKQLHDLFAIEESEDHAVTAALAAVGKRRQEYTSIQRAKPESTTAAPDASTSPATEATIGKDGKKQFHKDLMEHIVYATSTSTQVTSETEICYRGRCIRSEDLPPNHKLN